MLKFVFVMHVLYTYQLYMYNLYEYLVGSTSQNYKGNSYSKVLLINVTSLFVW